MTKLDIILLVSLIDGICIASIVLYYFWSAPKLKRKSHTSKKTKSNTKEEDDA